MKVKQKAVSLHPPQTRDRTGRTDHEGNGRLAVKQKVVGRDKLITDLHMIAKSRYEAAS